MSARLSLRPDSDGRPGFNAASMPTDAQRSRADPGSTSARLIFVGTAGAANVERCNVCFAIECAHGETLLLDTAGGFQVVHNLKLAQIDLASIRHIFLSHRHSDHLGGLEPLLLHLGLHALATGEHADRVAIYAHPVVIEAAQTVLRAMASVAPRLLERTGQPLEWRPLEPGQPVELRPGLRLLPFRVDHEPRDGSELGCRVEGDQAGQTWSIVYSGDTRPTAELSRHARGADVLIHEVGGFDADAERVHLPGHSTAGEAGRVATEAGVKRLFLSHLPREGMAGAVLEEVHRFYQGPAGVPNDLEAFDLRDLLATAVDVP